MTKTGITRACILLALRNGGADLAEQLQSFVAQDHGAWDLIVSDDGSTDDGPDIVRRFARDMARSERKVTLVDGPGAGSAANFLHLIAQVPGGTDWLAFSDQDDVWLPDRLSRGMAALGAVPQGTPGLYCSRTWITDARLENRRKSTLFRRDPGFSNALVQNIASGNTILLNRAGCDLVRAAAPEAQGVPGLIAHDWWVYQLITGAGGQVINDARPTLLYRQHGGNEIGANDGWRARRKRIGQLLNGTFADWTSANIAALSASSARLTPDNLARLRALAALRKAPAPARLRAFRQLGLYRQTRPAQLALWAAVLLGKV